MQFRHVVMITDYRKEAWRVTLKCGHVILVSKDRTDIHEAHIKETPVHCWECDNDNINR